jgi:hypothetical protein
MNFSSFIVVADDEFIVVIFDMHIFRPFEGQFKGLLVFHSDCAGDCIPPEDVFVIPAVELQDLLDNGAIPQLKLKELVCFVVDEAALPVGAVGVISEGYFDDVSARLVSYFIVDAAAEEDGSDGVLAEDDVVAAGRIVVVFADDSSAVIVQKQSLSVFLRGQHAAHVDCVVVVAKTSLLI